MIAGCTPEAVTAADASAAARTSGKVAAIVHTSPGTRRRSFRVAPTMTPSVPSEPITSEVRSRPVTPFTVRWPRRSSRPSASTRSTPSTASRTTPYFAHSRPPAPVAMLPPTVEMARLAGSGAHHSPCSASAAFRSALRMPGSTTASRSSGRTSRMRSIARTDSAISPAPAFAPPARPVPAPRVTTGVRVSVAMRRVACTSSTERAWTTASGMPDAACPDLSARAACQRGRRRVDAIAERGAQARDDVGAACSREAAPSGDDADRHGDDPEAEADPRSPMLHQAIVADT